MITTPLNRQNVQDILALTPLQEGMVYQYWRDSNSAQYFQQFFFHLSGKLEADLLQTAWTYVIERNEVLRSVFAWKNLPKPVQIVLRRAPLFFEKHDLSTIPDQTRRMQQLEQIKTADRNQTFDLEKGPLLRLYVCKLGEAEYGMILSFHHILFDGWSTGIILKELFAAYHTLAMGEKPVPQKKSPFKSYLKWCQTQNLAEQKEYWQDYLQGFDLKTLLPFDHPKVHEIQKAEQYRYPFSVEDTYQIKTFLKEHSITLGAFFYTVWGITLQKYTNSSDVVFGVTMSGRPAVIDEIEEMVGLFINTLPLRVQRSGTITALEVMQNLQQTIQMHQQFETTPLGEIKTCTEISAEGTLFDSILVLENYPIDQEINTTESPLRIDSYSTLEMTNFDLTITIQTVPQIELSFLYNVELFQPETIARMARHVQHVLSAVLTDAEVKLAEIDLLSKQEKEQILIGWNGSEIPAQQQQTLHSLFEARVSTYADQIALMYAQEHLTYQEFNQRVNQIAHCLRAKGVQPDQIVGILAERSLEMLAGIFGILKAGGAYLPIAHDAPEERVQYMLADSKVQILLTQNHLINSRAFTGEIVDLAGQDFTLYPETNPVETNQSTDLAYVIYTSGSTGKPKGVMVEHGSVVNLLEDLHRKYPVEQTDAYLFKTTYTFDVSVVEIFGWFFAGGRLVIPEQGLEKDLTSLVHLIKTQQITHLNLVPSALQAILQTLQEEEIACLQHLKYLFVAGEAISKRLVEMFYERVPGVALENCYGPTEATIYATRYSLADLQNRQVVPIGKPFQSIQTYIFNHDGQLQPIGAPGELFIGGAGVARGYMNRPELTMEKFGVDPFHPGSRMYQTGDSAKWLPDGNIEYLGRLDRQVKIRGFRIEPGEVEYHLLSHPLIKDVAVIPQSTDADESYLCGYIVTVETLTDQELRQDLQQRLPEYMIPAHFVRLEHLPLTPNGKVNRNALPKPVIRDHSHEFVAPRTELEMKLAQMWAEVLGLKQVGVHDNFFALGGHSLKAMYLLNKMTRDLTAELTLGDLFQNPTIAALAHLLDTQGQSDVQNKYTPMIQAVEAEYYPLSSAQQRIYILHQLDPGSLNYNMFQLLKIVGTLDVTRFREAFLGVIERHDALRTCFIMVNGTPVQKVLPQVQVAITEKLLQCRADLQEEAVRFVQPFDLQQAPLVRVGVFTLPEETYLLVDLHHIIADGVSIELFLKEFWALYEGKHLPPVHYQYKDFIAWQRQFFESAEIQRQSEYWQNQFSGELPVLNFSSDFQPGSIRSDEGATLSRIIDPHVTEEVQRFAAAKGITLYMLFLSVYYLMLERYSGQQDLIVGTPVSGRTHPDTSQIMGMFVNTLALRTEVSHTDSFVEYVQKIKELTITALAHQDYPFERLLEALELPVDLSRNPLFDPFFSFRAEEEEQLKSGELQLFDCQLERRVAKFDISLDIVLSGSQIELVLEYSTRLFKPDRMKRLLSHYVNLLQSVLKSPDQQISEAQMLSREEKTVLLNDFNNTRSPYAAEQLLHERFEVQVERTPKHLALRYKDVSLTYQELNHKANQLAHLLRKKGVTADSIVAIIIGPSLTRIIAILGVLKAGGAYLPIEPDLPVKRIEYMLEDSKPVLLLTASEWDAKIVYSGEVVSLSEETWADGAGNLLPVQSPHHLAYILYTSGSTGQPKGVMVEQRNVVAYIHAVQREIGLKEDDVALHQASYAFDGSIEEIFPILSVGGLLVVIEREELLDLKKLVSIIVLNKVTMISASPMLLNELNRLGLSQELRSLRILITAGDVLKREYIDHLVQYARVFNAYGPTEATVSATYYECTEPLPPYPSIGKPLANYQAYVVDPQGRLVPVGVDGELWVSGVGVSRGYLNRPELTQDKFTMNPFQPGTRVYRTGDLVRWLPDGNIQFIGRVDQQVKIRGFRIELGEIATTLMKHPEIQDAIVIDRKDGRGEHTICAYLVGETELSSTRLRAYLSEMLPDYMIPACFVTLPELPYTSTGKVDRQCLPEPIDLLEEVEYIPPVTEIEIKLAGIWAEVLGVQRISRTANFFYLGGHSLKATQLLGKIHQVFARELPLRDVFNHPVLQDMALCIEVQVESECTVIEPVQKQEYYLASSAQKRLYFLSELDSDSMNYHMISAISLQGPVDVGRLKNTFSRLLQRHEILRTSFVLVNGELMQLIVDQVNFTLEQWNEEVCEPERLFGNFIRPFDLHTAPLIRVGLVELPDSKLLMIDLHHIISDGLSVNLFIRDFLALYQGNELPDLRIQYKDYAAWQAQWFHSTKAKAQEAFWLGQFADEVPQLSLPTDHRRPVVMDFAGDTLRFTLEENVTRRLQQIAVENDATLYMVLLAIWNILLAKYTGSHDIVVGSPVAGRSLPEFETIMGMFVNTLPMRNTPAPQKLFTDFLAEVRTNTVAAFANQEFQLEVLIDQLPCPKDPGRNPLFDTIFALQNTGTPDLTLPDLQVTEVLYDHPAAKVDLTLIGEERNEQIELVLNYRTSLFRAETIQRMKEHFLQMVQSIVTTPGRRLGLLEMITPEERKRIVEVFNATETDYPRDQTLQTIFEKIVRQDAEKEAVKFGDQSLTYGQLNARANQVARSLRKYGIGADVAVGLMIPRSLEMIVGILAVLKAGGAYLPIDPAYPEGRIEFMLQDSETPLVLTHPTCRQKVSSFAAVILEVTDPALYHGEETDLEEVNRSSHLAYIMYTSGTTGKPKGNMTTHYNISRVVIKNNYVEITEKDRMLQLSNYAFDGSTFDIFGALLNGASLVLVPPELVLDVNYLRSFIIEEQISLFFVTTALFNTMIDFDLEIDAFAQVRKIVIGGERLSVPHIKKALKALGPHRLINGYGPTESTVFAATYSIAALDERVETIPIGQPMANTRIYILDPDHQLAPIGVIGELCIAGEGLARGYLKRPDLTVEKFVDLPFHPGERIYRTGDMARWLADGNIEFYGRRDQQVKIRGFRIECGEIEKCLLEYPGIKEAVVLAQEREGKNTDLAAYLVSENQPEVSELTAYLAKKLPGYMIPTGFAFLPHLPLTQNGKVDRRVLAEIPLWENVNRSYQAPAGPIEAYLAESWSEILGVEPVGVLDDFFELGGHSLSATRLLARVRERYQVSIPLKDFFAQPRIKDLAVIIQKSTKQVSRQIQAVVELDAYPVSFAQKRMYILEQFGGIGTGYNIPLIFKIEGELDQVRLKRSIHKLVQRHESLRTSFVWTEGEPMQKIHTELSLEMEEVWVTPESLDEKLQEFIRPFDLSQPPLLRVGLFQSGELSYIIFDLHHSITDGSSMRILGRELIQFYQGGELPQLPIQYKDYAVWQNHWLESEDFQVQESYWLSQFADPLPVLHLPLDHPRPVLMDFTGAEYDFVAADELTQKIKSFVQETDITLYMFLLAVYTVLLVRYAEEADLCVGTPVAGRTNAALESMIGMFVNTVVMRNHPTGEKSFLAYVQEVKTNTLAAFDHQEYPFELLVERLNLERKPGQNPLFDVFFVLQNIDFGEMVMGQTRFVNYHLAQPVTKTDITLTAVEVQGEIQFTFTYRTKLFEYRTIAQLAGDYLQLLSKVITESHLTIEELTSTNLEELRIKREIEAELNQVADVEFDF